MKRFVTYIYVYEDKKKGANIGYAKIEIRGEDCRIEIHLRGVFVGRGTFQAYLFWQEGKELVGIAIGDIKIISGSGKFVGGFKATELGGSAYGIYDMDGLCLVGEDGRMFASRWKEGATAEISCENFRTWQAGSSEEQTEAQELPIREVQSELSGKELRPQEAPQELSLQEVQSEPIEKEMPKEEACLKLPEQKTMPQELQEEDLSATEIPVRNVFPRCDWMMAWEHFQKEYEVLTPFENTEIYCIQIELKDLRNLPKKCWYLGNNSFLLHGFFNYQHLLIGNMEGERWFIGIPGIYQRQERVMAAIFGFPEFLPEAVAGEAQKENEPTNRFGYWYRVVEE
ncbi:MAG: DUF6128 domain-containing protein [Roseburia sp.]